MVAMPKINVAAIDNGLAFPFKHPDEWRACKSVSTFYQNLKFTEKMTGTKLENVVEMEKRGKLAEILHPQVFDVK